MHTNDPKRIDRSKKEIDSMHLKLFEQVNFGLMIIENYKLVFYNSWIKKLISRDNEVPDLTTFINCLFPKDRRLLTQTLKSFSPNSQNDLRTLQCRFNSMTIGEKWIQIQLSDIEWLGNQAIQLAIFEDFSAKEKKSELELSLKNTKKQLFEEKLRLRSALNKIRKIEQRLAEVQLISKIGNWEWDLATNKTYWSDGLYKILGVDKSKLIPSKDSFLQCVHPDDRDRLLLKIKLLIDTKTPFSTDHRIILHDGTIRFINSLARIESNNKGRLVRIYGISQDITVRKNTEAELLVKSSAIAASISGIGMTDSHGKLVYVNSAFVKMWGYNTDSELLDKSLVDLWEGDSFNLTINEIKERGGKIGEGVGIRKHGASFNVQYSATMINDENGNPFCLFGSFIDISLRKQMEERLLQSAYQLAEIQKSAQMGSWEWFFDTEELVWSDEVYHIFEFILATKPSWNRLVPLIHPNDKKEFQDIIEQVISGEKEWYVIQYRIITTGGQEKNIYEEGKIIKGTSGKPQKIIGLSQDITRIIKTIKKLD